MIPQVYITKISKFLPGEAIGNDEMEEYLGFVGGMPSKSKPIVLRSNGIKTRYYSIDKTGKQLYNNAQLNAIAIKGLFDDDFKEEDLELLTCGTTFSDQILPSHASMVHGELGGKNYEAVSCQGSCLSGFQAFKIAFMNLKAGLKQNAVCGASEMFSTSMRANQFEEESKKLAEIENTPYIAFERDFLRWMLSDGAAAVRMETKPNPNALSIRVDWIEATSYANELKTCMYIGGEIDKNGDLKGWREFDPQHWLDHSLFAISQDTKMLGANILKFGARFLREITEKHQIKGENIDWFLPHISSMFFFDKAHVALSEVGIKIADEKWFTNLPRIGNVGSAAIFFMLEELLKEDKLKKGDRILAMVPESARFAYGYMHFTVV